LALVAVDRLGDDALVREHSGDLHQPAAARAFAVSCQGADLVICDAGQRRFSGDQQQVTERGRDLADDRVPRGVPTAQFVDD
jgi:hypothetical protein